MGKGSSGTVRRGGGGGEKVVSGNSKYDGYVFTSDEISVAGLPPLEGSAKQVSWAESIRQDAISTINNTVSESKRSENDDDYWDYPERTYSAVRMANIIRDCVPAEQRGTFWQDFVQASRSGDHTKEWSIIDRMLPYLGERLRNASNSKFWIDRKNTF